MTDIVLWYDDVNQGNCQCNDAVYASQTIIEKLKINDIDFTVNDTEQEICSSSVNVYVIELLNVYTDRDVFSLITEKTKMLFRNGLKLLLYYPREGHELAGWLLTTHSRIKDNGLEFADIYLVYGDVDINANYCAFLDENNIESFLTPIAMDYFKGDYYEKVTNCVEMLSVRKDFDFLFYNGKLRPHRLLSVAELHRRGILNRGLVSLTATLHTGESYTLDSCLELIKEHLTDTDFLSEYISNWQPLILDKAPSEFGQDNINDTTAWHYNDTYFSVISETSLTSRFITEKLYKPIYNLHPFIVLGAPGMLQLLRDKGYRTFPEMFDESYDVEECPVRRIYLVIDEIEKFTKLSDKDKQDKLNSVKNTLAHNQRVYLHQARNKRQDLVSIFEKIYES